MNLQDSFLNQVRKDNADIQLVLLDGTRLTGLVRGFDNFTVILNAHGMQHMIYKHAIAQIIHRRMAIPDEQAPAQEGAPAPAGAAVAEGGQQTPAADRAPRPSPRPRFEPRGDQRNNQGNERRNDHRNEPRGENRGPRPPRPEPRERTEGGAPETPAAGQAAPEAGGETSHPVAAQSTPQLNSSAHATPGQSQQAPRPPRNGAQGRPENREKFNTIDFKSLNIESKS